MLCSPLFPTPTVDCITVLGDGSSRKLDCTDEQKQISQHCGTLGRASQQSRGKFEDVCITAGLWSESLAAGGAETNVLKR